MTRGLVDDCAEVAGVETSLPGDGAFFERGEALDLPRREKQVGKRDDVAAEDRADAARPALGSIEMDDVRELMREDELQPVVGRELRSLRPRRVDDDRVVGKGRGVAVGQI